MSDRDLPDQRQTSVTSRRLVGAAALFGAIAVLIGLDLLDDAGTGADWPHLIFEALVMTLALAGVASLWSDLQVAQARAARLDVDLEAAKREAARFKADAAEALQGLGEAIDRQFERWALTPAEREVGLLLLKGLSHRELAEIRATSEATVRQQALGIYRKSGLRNRSELSAFFLEDLLLPRQTG